VAARNCVHDRRRGRRTVDALRTFCPRPRCRGAACLHHGGMAAFRCADARANRCGAQNAHRSDQNVDARETKHREMDDLRAGAKIAAARHCHAPRAVGRGGICQILSARRTLAPDPDRGARAFAMVFPRHGPAHRRRRAAVGPQTADRARADRSPFEIPRCAAHMPACRRIFCPQSASQRAPRPPAHGGGHDDGHRCRSADGDLRDAPHPPCQMRNKAFGDGIFRRQSWQSPAFRIFSLLPRGLRSVSCRQPDVSASPENRCVCRDRGA